MQFALLIYESPEAFASRNKHETDSYHGAWRAFHKAIVEAGSSSPATHFKSQRPEPRCD